MVSQKRFRFISKIACHMVSVYCSHQDHFGLVVSFVLKPH